MRDSALANLSVRRIDDEVLTRLRVRAAQHGISMEEEVRQILRRAVAAPNRLGDLASQFFGSQYGVNLDLPAHKPHESLELSE